MGTQNFSLSHARDKTKKHLSQFFTELKTYHLYFSVNGQFNEHEHSVTSLLQRCANGNKPDLQLALKIEDRKESKRARVCLPQLYIQTKTKRVMYLIRIF